MKQPVILLATALVLAVAICFVPSHLVRYCLAFPLLWLLPGLGWTGLPSLQPLDRVERLVLGLGLSFVVTPTVTLLVAYLPGPVTRAALLTAIVGITGLPVVLSLLTHSRRQVKQTDIGVQRCSSILTVQHPLWRDGWAWLLVAILVATGVRVVNLNYAEFESDEAKIFLRTAQALEGDEDIIFQHKKGPTQLTAVMGVWRLTGAINEWMARLPFTWASILGVVAVFLCGRRLGRPHAGGIAACLLAVEGYLVGLGRGVKYHSLVFALCAIGLLCLLAYYTHRRGSLLIVSAALFAGGALAHYDAVVALPAGLLVVAARLWLDRQQARRAMVPALVAALTGLFLAGLFYVPFLRSPFVEHTSSYVSGRLGGHVYNNLWSTFELSAVYDSIYLLAMMTLALSGQTLVTWARWGRVGLVVSVILLIGAAAGLVWPEVWVVKDLTLAWIPPTILLFGALLAPGQSMGVRAVWLWLGIPALFYLFFVAVPLTHVYTAFPGWAMMAGIGLDNLGRWLARRSHVALRLACAAGGALYALCTVYAVILFVGTTPEYLRNLPQSKSPIYWTPYQQLPIEIGLYGFPYRVGWKAVGYLMDEGQLAGTYDSNEKERAAAYYTRQATRINCASPDMYIIATNVLDEMPVRWDQIETEYGPAMVITVDGQPRLTVYRRDVDGPPVTTRVEEYERLFDLGTTPERLARSASAVRGLVDMQEYTSHDAIIGDFAHLVGYKIDTGHAVPGGYVELTLLWQALKPAPIDYQVFTHLHNGQTMWGQLDGTPLCGNLPTSRWQADQLFADPYRIPIRTDAPPGPVPMTIGMYNLATMERLPVLSSRHEPTGDTVYLTDIDIRSP